MRTLVLLTALILIVLVACDRQNEEKNQKIVSPRVVEANGYVVPEDSIESPKVIPAGKPRIRKAGTPNVALTNTNVVPAGLPKVVLAGNPQIYIPEKDSIFLPKTVPAIDKPFPVGTPEMALVKDAKTKDHNPQNFSSFTKLQGLNHNNIFCIIQDDNGNLWFGTGGGGASRYDGKYFTHFTKKEGLSNDLIAEIIQDKNGNLWFGTWGGGVCRYDGRNISQFTVNEGLSYDVVLSLFEDKRGNIWVGMMDGSVCKYDGKSFTQFSVKYGVNEYPVNSILQDKSEDLWFGTLGNGVYCYNGKSLRHFTKNEGLSSNDVHCMLLDKTGNIWFGMESGVCLYDGKSFKHFTAKEGLSNYRVRCIMQEKSGNLWFGTDGDGVFFYNGSSFTHFTESEGLGNNSVYSLFEDRCGNIWIGGNGSGVSRYYGRSFTHYTEREGLSDRRVLGIIQDKSGALWFGTWSGGVNRYDGKSFTHYTQKEGFSNNLITYIFQDKTGNLWFGTYAGGVICYDGKSFLHFTEEEGMCYNWVESIMDDKDGNLWFATDGGGVCRYDGKYFTCISENEGLSFNGVLCEFKDRSGNLWFGTSRGGLNRYDGKSFTHFTSKEGLSNDFVTTIIQDRIGNMWFGTNGGGACRYDGKSFMYFTEKEGLPSNKIQSILQDNRGNLWFGTPNGLSKLPDNYRMKLLKASENGGTEQPVLFKNYLYEDGFLGIGCFHKSIYEDTDGTIWIGTNDRLTAYHPEGDEPDTIAPNIQMTGLQLFNEDIAWHHLAKNKDTSLILGNGVKISNFAFDSISKHYFLPERLSLAYNNNYLTFTFIGITLKQSSQVKYKFKLEGLDENWSAPSTRTEAPYGNIPPGSYTFKVKAMNSEGYWSEEFNFSFTIRPPWWKTWWAYTGYILIILGGIGTVIYSIFENQRKKIRLIITERNRIARELHDDIGAELTRITILSQSLHKNPNVGDDIREKLRKISETGKKVLGSIGEIIWTMNPQKDNLDGLAAYIRRFVTEYFETNDIDLNIEFPNEIPPKSISDEYRRNVFLVIKEAASNITKYSKATHVKLTMNVDEKSASFEISDDGTGFSVREKENWGNGLRNMHQRMKDIGGTFLITSETDHGTFIRMTFPVR